MPLCIVICIAGLLIPNVLCGQTLFFDWARSFNSSLNSFANDVQADAVGNVYVVGNFSGTTDFDPGPGVVSRTATNFDAYIIKLNPAGQFVWVIQLGEVGSDMAWALAIDGANDLYVTGSFTDTTDFDPGPGVVELTPAGQTDMFVCKFTPTGGLVWARNMGGPNHDSGIDIAVAPDGSIYTTGQFRDTADFDPGPAVYNIATTNTDNVFVCKLDSGGNLDWVRDIGSTGPDVPKSLSLDPQSGAVCVSGTFTGTVDFDPGPGAANLTGNGSMDCFFLKLDSLGNYVWAKQVGGPIDDVAYSIAVDGAGNVVSTGYFKGMVDFDPGPGLYTLPGGNQPSAFILQLDAAGSFVWARQLGTAPSSVTGYAITVDSLNDIYQMGQFYGWADFDPGAGTTNLASTGYDIYTLKLDQSGNFLWVQQITGTQAEHGRALSVDRAGNIYTAGQYTGTTDFDPGPGTYTLPVPLYFNAFAHKIRYCAPTHSILDVTACDTFVSPSGLYTWTSPGIYGDTLPNAGGCDSILLIRLNIISLPLQPDSIAGDIHLCAGSSASYSVPPVSGAFSYLWTLPGGWTGSSTTPFITATADTTSGVIAVSVVNACGTSTPQTLAVTVSPVPTAAFSSSTNLLAAAFTDQSQGATSWSWEFGDGNVSTLQSPSHIYAAPGTYTVCLIATANGCADTVCHPVTVIAVGVHAPQALGVAVYPNPSNGLFHLKTDRALSGRVIDAQGRCLLHANLVPGENLIDLSGMVEGCYFLQVQDGESAFGVRLLRGK